MQLQNIIFSKKTTKYYLLLFIKKNIIYCFTFLYLFTHRCERVNTTTILYPFCRLRSLSTTDDGTAARERDSSGGKKMVALLNLNVSLSSKLIAWPRPPRPPQLSLHRYPAAPQVQCAYRFHFQQSFLGSLSFSFAGSEEGTRRTFSESNSFSQRIGL